LGAIASWTVCAPVAGVTGPSVVSYHVSSTSLRTRSFASLWKAAALFLEEARRAAPSQKQEESK
jgi:hypothetical protein